METIRFYDGLREHIPEPAARLIAEEMTSRDELQQKLDQLATKQDFERLRSSLFRWQLSFFVPLWLGVYGTLAVIALRGL